jgi:hypothetical protein
MAPVTSATPSSVLDVAGRLRAALDALAAALATADPIAVLDAEPQITSALAVRLPMTPVTDAAERAAARQELARARETLHQCRGAGTAIADLIHATLMALGRDAEYDRQGARPDGVVRGRGLQARG